MKLSGVSYNPKTGEMRRFGKPLNTADRNGYKRISIGNKNMLQHRVAWYLAYGYWANEIDHINRDKTDNRLFNLRDCTRTTNRLNAGLRSDNKSGKIGVSWYKPTQSWQVNHAGEYIRRYKNLTDAISAKEELERCV